MEYYIKDVTDITYLSELTLDILRRIERDKMSRVNSQTQATDKKEAAIIYVAPSELP